MFKSVRNWCSFVAQVNAWRWCQWLYLMCAHTSNALEHTEAAEYSEQVKRRAHLLLGNPSLLAHWLTLGSGIQTHTGINWGSSLCPLWATCRPQTITLKHSSFTQHSFFSLPTERCFCEIDWHQNHFHVRENRCYSDTGWQDGLLNSKPFKHFL